MTLGDPTCGTGGRGDRLGDPLRGGQAAVVTDWGTPHVGQAAAVTDRGTPRGGQAAAVTDRGPPRGGQAAAVTDWSHRRQNVDKPPVSTVTCLSHYL